MDSENRSVRNCYGAALRRIMLKAKCGVVWARNSFRNLIVPRGPLLKKRSEL
jgi:hypothetical protein